MRHDNDKIVLHVRRGITPGGRYSLCVQVVWMDERFRNPATRPLVGGIYEHKVQLRGDTKTFTIRSHTAPLLTKDGFHLYGFLRFRDTRLSSLYFTKEAKREQFLQDVLYALRDWADNWPHWNSVQAAPSRHSVELVYI